MLVDHLPEINGKLSLKMADSFVSYIMMMIVIIKKSTTTKEKPKERTTRKRIRWEGDNEPKTSSQEHSFVKDHPLATGYELEGDDVFTTPSPGSFNIWQQVKLHIFLCYKFPPCNREVLIEKANEPGCRSCNTKQWAVWRKCEFTCDWRMLTVFL